MDTVRINEKDNVSVDLNTGHKIALCDIEKDTDIIGGNIQKGYVKAKNTGIRIKYSWYQKSSKEYTLGKGVYNA